MVNKRIDKINYYLDIAETVAERSTCLSKHYGAVIVKDDELISTGYNGAPRCRKNCCDLGYCIREKFDVPRGRDYTLCRSTHSEQNAIINASRDRMIGSTLYLSGIDCKTNDYVLNANCCPICRRMVINAGIKEVIIRINKKEYKIVDVQKEYIENDDSLNITREGY